MEKELLGSLHISAKANIEFGLFNSIIINSIYKNKFIYGAIILNWLRYPITVSSFSFSLTTPTLNFSIGRNENGKQSKILVEYFIKFRVKMNNIFNYYVYKILRRITTVIILILKIMLQRGELQKGRMTKSIPVI